MQEHEEELGEAAAPRAIRWMPVVFVAFVAVLIILAFWPPRQTPRTDQGANHPAVGAKLSSIELQPLTGGGSDVSLEDISGKVCFINFWGPWCGPCGIEFPHLVELEKKYDKSPQFLFLSVACSPKVDEEGKMLDATIAFLKRERASFPVYQDAHARTRIHILNVAKLGNPENFSFPTTVIVGRDGKIRGFWEGYAQGDELAMLDVVQAALKGP